jgi:hypothetical protein
MSLDLYAVGTALAAQVATVTAPADVSMGGTVIRGSTVEAPNSIPNTPYVVVVLPSGEVTAGGGERVAVHNFPVYFLYQRSAGDLPRETKTMLQWLGPLLDATISATSIGLAAQGVKSALLESYEPVIYEYAGTEYHAWRFVYAVRTRDAVTYSP